MKTIEFTAPFTVGEDGIVKAEIRPLAFSGFAKATQDASSAARNRAEKLAVIIQRYRMIAQTTLVTGGDKRIPLTEEIIAKLPAMAGRDIVNNLLAGNQSPGKLLSDKDADGISKAIHYQLGTPVQAAGGKEITELEFLAKDFTAIEEVMTGTSPVDQTMTMISVMSRPADGSMLRLPSWAADQISLADGIFLMENVLNRFLE